MFGDTIVLPLSSGNVTLTKVNSGENYSGEYRFGNATDQYRVMVRHSKAKALADGLARDRHNLEILHTIFATSTVPEIVRKTYQVIEVAANDPSIILADGLADWLIASSNANLLKLVNWES